MQYNNNEDICHISHEILKGFVLSKSNSGAVPVRSKAGSSLGQSSEINSNIRAGSKQKSLTSF